MMRKSSKGPQIGKLSLHSIVPSATPSTSAVGCSPRSLSHTPQRLRARDSWSRSESLQYCSATQPEAATRLKILHSSRETDRNREE